MSSTKTFSAPSSVHAFLTPDHIVTPFAATSRRPSQLSNPSFRRHVPVLPLEKDAPNLYRVALSQSIESGSSVDSNFLGFLGKYKLNRVASRESMSSQFSVESRYHVTLELSPKEISLLRYMWNRMLGEESEAEPPATERRSTLPIPGSLWNQAKEKPLPSVTKAHHQFGASSTFCSQLYLNLLSMDPNLETAFPSLRHQAVSMAGVLSLAVNSLENLSSLDSYLVTLANRHSRVLGIEPPQFEMMGEAFIQTFHERFGTRFTHELEVLWIKFYMYLANSLLQFGVDPVMKPTGDYTHERFGSVSLVEDLVFTGETDDIMSLAEDPLRRLSLATDISSMASVVAGKLPANSSRQGSVISAHKQRRGLMSALLLASHTARALKKKTSLVNRKKGECTIM